MIVNLYKALQSCYKYRSMKPVDDKWGCQLHDDDGGGGSGGSGDGDNDDGLL